MRSRLTSWRGAATGAAALILAAALVMAGCSRTAPETPAQFTRSYAEALRSAVPDVRVEIIDDLALSVIDSDGGESTVYLDNAFGTYLLDPSQKVQIIERFVKAGRRLSAVNGAPVDATRIVPVVKDRGWIDQAQAAVVEGGDEEVPHLACEEINEVLFVVYAEDSPESLRFLTVKDLEGAEVPLESVRTLALENLVRILPKMELHGSEGTYMITAGGNFEASLLLLDSLWSGDQLVVKGEIVAAIPTRDLLLVTGSDDSDGLARLRALVAESHERGPYRISPILFIYRNGEFVEFE